MDTSCLGVLTICGLETQKTQCQKLKKAYTKAGYIVLSALTKEQKNGMPVMEAYKVELADVVIILSGRKAGRGTKQIIQYVTEKGKPIYFYSEKGAENETD